MSIIERYLSDSPDFKYFWYSLTPQRRAEFVQAMAPPPRRLGHWVAGMGLVYYYCDKAPIQDQILGIRAIVAPATSNLSEWRFSVGNLSSEGMPHGRAASLEDAKRIIEQIVEV